MKVLFFIPATLLPRGNTQVSNDCTQLGKTFSKKFEKPLDKPKKVCYNINVNKGKTHKRKETKNMYISEYDFGKKNFNTVKKVAEHFNNVGANTPPLRQILM